MAKRILVWLWVALYLLTFLAGTILFFMTEGSFSPASRYFWSYTGLPAIILLVHLAAAGLLAWNRQRGAAAAIAVEVFWLVAAVVGLIFFVATFRWIVLAAVLRVSVGGVILSYLWGPFRRDRGLIAVGAALGLLLGILWPITLQPQGDGAVPLVSSGGKELLVWPRSGAKPYTEKKALKFHGGQVIVQDSPPVVDLQMGQSVIRISPMFAFPSISVDGAWSTTLNTIVLGFRSSSNATTWQDDRYQYIYSHYQILERTASRLARSLAYGEFRDGMITGDLYVRVDRKGEGFDLVVLTHCDREIYVYRAALFTLILQPYAGQKIILPPIAEALSWRPDSSGGVPRRLLNLQPGRAVLYNADQGNRGPFTELAQAEQFADHLVVENFGEGRSLLVYFPDWQGQALKCVSPAAGEPFCANELYFDLVPLEAGMAQQAGRPNYLSVAAVIAGTDSGAGRPVVRMAGGTYVNRMAIRLVPDGVAPHDVIRSIDLWQPAAKE